MVVCIPSGAQVYMARGDGLRVHCGIKLLVVVKVCFWFGFWVFWGGGFWWFFFF